MRVINAFLVDSTLSLRAATLSTVELENDVYLFKAQLQELRNELQLLRQNDSANLKAETEAVMREIESLNQKFSELVASLKAEVAMDLNSHKADAREVGTDADLRIQEIHHKLVLRLSDIKTKIEAMKVEMTRMIVWMVIGLVGTLIFVDWVYPTPTAKEPTPTLPSTPLFPMFGMLPPPHTTGSASPPASSSTSVASRPSKTF
ncbi:hypothetical protein HK105_201167 [Polyrhizophydium stewartii]|uniref:Uncharacterized protein n=1 Tax=Polyrhizophydium stewartii TaxID=2732419 RepID=A0ABR4NJ05_9FUNG